MAKMTIASLELRVQQLEVQLLALSAAVEKATTAAQAAAVVATAPKTMQQKAAPTISRDAWMAAVRDLQEQFPEQRTFPRHWVLARAEEMAEEA